MEEEESKEEKSSLHYVKSVTGVTASDDLIRHSSKRHVTNIYICVVLVKMIRPSLF